MSPMYASYVCSTSNALLIISVRSTCRDVCQLCADTSHLLSFLSVHSLSLSLSLWITVSLSHTLGHTCSTLYIVSLNLPGSLRAKFRSFVSVSGLTYDLICSPSKPSAKSLKFFFFFFLHCGCVYIWRYRFLAVNNSLLKTVLTLESTDLIEIKVMVPSQVTKYFSFVLLQRKVERFGTPKVGMNAILYSLHSA